MSLEKMSVSTPKDEIEKEIDEGKEEYELSKSQELLENSEKSVKKTTQGKRKEETTVLAPDNIHDNIPDNIKEPFLLKRDGWKVEKSLLYFKCPGETKAYDKLELKHLNEKLKNIPESVLLKSVDHEHGEPEITVTMYYLLTSNEIKPLVYKRHTGYYFSVADNGSWAGGDTYVYEWPLLDEIVDGEEIKEPIKKVGAYPDYIDDPYTILNIFEDGAILTRGTYKYVNVRTECEAYKIIEPGEKVYLIREETEPDMDYRGGQVELVYENKSKSN